MVTLNPWAAEIMIETRLFWYEFEVRETRDDNSSAQAHAHEFYYRKRVDCDLEVVYLYSCTQKRKIHASL